MREQCHIERNSERDFEQMSPLRLQRSLNRLVLPRPIITWGFKFLEWSDKNLNKLIKLKMGQWSYERFDKLMKFKEYKWANEVKTVPMKLQKYTQINEVKKVPLKL